MTQENQQSNDQQNQQQSKSESENQKGGDDKQGFKPPASQDEFDRMVKDRLDRANTSHQQEVDQLKQQLKDLESKKPTEEKDDKSSDQPKSALEKEMEKLRSEMEQLANERKAAEDAKSRVAAVKAEKLDEEWADLIAGESAADWTANAKKVSSLISKSIQDRKAPDTNTGHQSSKGPRGQANSGSPEFKFRSRGKQVTVS